MEFLCHLYSFVPLLCQSLAFLLYFSDPQGMGGGYIVGWLPVVKEDKAHAGKPAWANFQATVWHKSFERILSSLAAKSKTALVFLLILILSSDFEEQLTMVLTHGVRALWPCPVCLVPHDKLSDMSHCYPHCTSRDLEAILETARERETAEEREEVLKDYGLHDVTNSFSTVSSTDVHHALSWDKLHFHSGSLWSDHLWVMNISFTDNSMHEDILKMIVYATHNILTEADCPLGYLLLRFYTMETISSGQHTYLAFAALLQQYINKTVESDKNWNFLKLHMGSHIFDDVEAKGATCNYNTKPNEKMHGSLKDSYLLCTNFRDVAEQRPVSTSNSFHMKLGSKQPPLTFNAIQTAHQADQAFINFHVKLNDFLNVLLPLLSIPLPEGKHIHLRGTDEITEHCFICINYESMVNWHQHTDYLHSNPCFFGSPHFNCIFIQLTENKVILGQLVFCFECLVGNNTFPLALVHPFDVPTGLCTRKDKDLNLYRVRARPRAQAQFFPVRSFICGALLIADGPSDYLIVDTADTDMFLRIKMMHLEAGHIMCI
ncbi:hypothetical protein BDR04DRAFT_1126623 [Suillus decipiens]|nr:hypothetical protein BDR04DRAFT_1126623 [Suillus decipiens]